MLKLRKSIGFLLLLFSVLTKADINTKDNYYPFLAQGFNINNYQKCRFLTQKCPLDGAFPASSCVEKVIAETKACGQFAKLLDVVDGGASPITLFAKQVKGFTLLDSLYVGDGQHDYYIIAKGKLIHINIAPDILNKVLAKQYKLDSLFIVNWGEPKYHVNPDTSQKFTAVFRITDGCLACSVIGWATTEFNFTKEGDFLGATLKSFKSTSRP